MKWYDWLVFVLGWLLIPACIAAEFVIRKLRKQQ